MRSNDAGKEMTDSRPMVNSSVAISKQFKRSLRLKGCPISMNFLPHSMEAADANLGHHRRSMSGTSRVIYL